MTPTVHIVGGGIGGLTAAVTLHQMGFAVRVFERAPVLREVGAGLGLLSNAMRVLDAIGLAGRARQLGHAFRSVSLANTAGRLLSDLPLDQVVPPDAPPSCLIHRADLHRLLLNALPEGVVQTDARCTGFTQDADGVMLHFEDRTDEHADVLIGADGLYSVVRHALWGAAPVRYAGQTCYRGIAHLELNNPSAICEIYGPGRRGCAASIGHGRVYWWAALNAPAGERDEPARRKEMLLEAFRDWPFQLPDAIAATDPARILRNDLLDRPPLKRWSRGRVTLLGDAAHPMQPNLGQGACTALEDAYVLACALSRHRDDPEAALRIYERIRIPRTSEIVTHAWRMGQPVRWRHPLAVRVRDTLTAATPRACVRPLMRRCLAYDATAVPV
jgi:2-polyprenyl-6-methoxyphenol hydroxylase-like FAD-dependent oxidoreductase